jgi:hypothetical protein
MEMIKWTEADIKKLLSCKDDDELIIAFPDHKIDSLTRKRRKLIAEGWGTSSIEVDKKSTSMKAEMAILKHKNQELLKLSNLNDRVLEYNRKTIEALPKVEIPPMPIFDKHKTQESVVLVGSCWHIGEVIDKQVMGGLNEYNFEIFKKRFQYLIEKTISFTTKNMANYQFPELHVLLTGDMVSGVIHDELEATNDLNIVEQATVGALIVAQGFQDLARAFPKVIVTCVVGNHGRVKHEKYFKHKQQINWDYVFYTNLALLLKNQKNVSFNIPMSFWAGVQIQGHNFLVMHGDLIKSWGGIPFYGLSRVASKWTEIMASQKEFFQFFVASHFHTKAVLQTPSGEQIMNASLKGGDEYAAGLGLYGSPIQILFGVNEKYGKTWELSVNTKYADKTVKPRYICDRTKNISQQL